MGFGIGAASLIGNTRFRNTADRKAYERFYLEDLKSPCQDREIKEEKQVLRIEEQMEEFMFLGLRMSKGVSRQEFFRCFGRELDEVYPGVVEDFCKKGLLQCKKDCEAGNEWISLTDYGVDVSNYVMAEFLISFLERH